jgi:hypothetical protein
MTSACDEVLALAAHLETWGLDPGRLLLDPLMRPHTEYFSGAVLQVGGRGQGGGGRGGREGEGGGQGDRGEGRG